jgi:hypothetical protein
MRPSARVFSIVLLFASLAAVAAQAQPQPQEVRVAKDPYAQFPLLLPLVITDEVFPFRTDVERLVRSATPALNRADGVAALADTLVSLWDRYGDFMVRQHGDFYEMSRGRAYWLIVTDDAADTVTDRLGKVLESFVRTHPVEKLSSVRAEWETGAAKLGTPSNRIFGFQFIELARRGAQLRDQLLTAYPESKDVIYDAYVRFLWDLMQFYRQLHATWFDKHTMRVAQEDWIVHRLVSVCKEPKWKLLFSLTAIGVDTTNSDPMRDKFMHRIVVADPACPDTADFVIPLPHYRLMEKELNAKSETEKKEILDRMMKQHQAKPEAAEPRRKTGSPGAPAPGQPVPPKTEGPR